MGTSEDFLCCGMACCARSDGAGLYCTGRTDPSNSCKRCDGGTISNVTDGTSCQTTDRCITGSTCTAGTCGGGTPVTCSPNTECRTFACNSSTGACQATALTGTACSTDNLTCTTDQCTAAGECGHTLAADFCLINGACHAAGTENPANECEVCTPATSTSAWSPKASGTTCGDDPSCSGGVLTRQDRCNGAGACTDNGTATCGAYANCADATSCDTDCIDASECVAGATCDNSMCVAAFLPGADCTDNNQCANGNCVDNVCCLTVCDAICQTCNGTTPGTCEPVAAGDDPDGDCPDDGVATCDRDGTCDGAGACRMYGSQQCAESVCDANGDVTAPRTCNAGECTGGGNTIDCSAGVCVDGTCNTGCTVDADCALGSWCDGNICSNANRAPVATIMAPGSVKSGESFHIESEGTADPDGDTLTFSWSQTSGPQAMLGGRDRAVLSVTSPETTEDVVISFRLTVSDSELTATADASVTVTGTGAEEGCGCRNTSAGLVWMVPLAAALLWRRRRA